MNKVAQVEIYLSRDQEYIYIYDKCINIFCLETVDFVVLISNRESKIFKHNLEHNYGKVILSEI